MEFLFHHKKGEIMAQRTEKVSQMIQNFYKDYAIDGKTVSEIAEKYGVSISSIYKNMGIIAEINSVCVSELYKKTKGGKNVGTMNSMPEGEKGVSIDEAQQALDEIDGLISKAQRYIESRVEEMKRYIALYERKKEG